MTGRPQDPVEDLLAATLRVRADEPVWRATLVHEAVRAAGAPVVRRVRPAVAGLSAAAAVAVLAVGTAALVGGTGTAEPASGGPGTVTSSAAVSSPVPGVSGAGDTSGAGPEVEYATCAQARAALGGATAMPHNRALTIDPLYTGPGSGDWVSGGGFGTATGDVAPSTDVAPSGGASPTTDPAFTTALENLDLALDGRRFAYMNVGFSVIVVNVVRGVDEQGALALVRSCTPAGADVRTQLVERSQAELEALFADVARRAPRRFPDLSGAWIDTDTNRVLIGATTTPTREQVAWVEAQWAGTVAVADLTTGRVVVP